MPAFLSPFISPLNNRTSFVVSCATPTVQHHANTTLQSRCPPRAIIIDPPVSLTNGVRNDLAVGHYRDAVTRLEEALNLQTDQDARVISYAILHDIILQCSRNRKFDLALRALSIIERTGFVISRSTSCSLLNSLSRAGRVQDCHRLLHQLAEPHITLFDGTLRQLTPDEVLRRMPDEKIIANVANAATNNGRADISVLVMNDMRDLGIPFTHYSYSVMLKAYGRLKRTDEIARLLADVEANADSGVLDAVVLDTAVDALVRCNDIDAAMRVVDGMGRLGFIPTARSFNPILRVLARRADVSGVEQLVERMSLCGINPTIHTRNAMVTAYSRAGRFADARDALVELAQASRIESGKPMNHDVCAGFSALAGELARHGQLKAAVQTLKELTARVAAAEMGRELEREVGVAVTAVVSALLDAGETAQGWILFRSMRSQFKVRAPADMYNTVVRGLSKRGDRVALEAATQALDEMWKMFRGSPSFRQRGRKDERECSGEASDEQMKHAFNDLINGHVRCGDATGAERILDEMEAKGLKPDIVSYTSVINGHGRDLDVLSARRVLLRMRKSGVQADRTAMNALIGACVRSGDISAAVRVFDGMIQAGGQLQPDIVSYSALIAGYVRESNLDKAWEMYEGMKKNGIRPNERLIERMIAAFVTPSIKPSRGEVRKDVNMEEVWGWDDEEGEEDEEVEIKMRTMRGGRPWRGFENGKDKNESENEGEDETEEEIEEEIEEEDAEMMDESLLEKLLSSEGWTSKRAAILMEDMERIKCSEVNKRRWVAAIRSIWD